MGETIYSKSRRGRTGYRVGSSTSPPPTTDEIPEAYLRVGPIGLPEVSEPQVMRHYIGLSAMNHHVDKDLFPLGSCTMKYNPKINEDVAGLTGFSGLHPEQAENDVQGALEVMAALEEKLAVIAGMDAVTLQTAAGAQGELLGLMLAKAYFEDRGEKRTTVLVPDSAHGTNPSSAAVAGFGIKTFKSGDDGRVDVDVLAGTLDDDIAVLMLTVPNTLGLFETQIDRITGLVHDKGGLCYMDGANLNALMGRCRPGDLGFDVMHFNLHKTFSTPHGGGGPGSGPVGVKRFLEPYLPVPRVRESEGRYSFDYDCPKSVGALHSYFGNFAIVLRALVYITRLGAEGIRRASGAAILNANYLAALLSKRYPIPYGERCMHEFVATGEPFKKCGVRTLDIAKRLLDFGFYAPTVYFPLVVPEALMVEPTETEGKETLDRFAEALERIAAEAVESPDILKEAPHHTPVRRLDETTANRNPVITAPRSEE
jgi:glycine dehydrogenase subunit 2